MFFENKDQKIPFAIQKKTKKFFQEVFSNKIDRCFFEPMNQKKLPSFKRIYQTWLWPVFLKGVQTFWESSRVQEKLNKKNFLGLFRHFLSPQKLYSKKIFCLKYFPKKTPLVNFHQEEFHLSFKNSSSYFCFRLTF